MVTVGGVVLRVIWGVFGAWAFFSIPEWSNDFQMWWNASVTSPESLRFQRSVGQFMLSWDGVMLDVRHADDRDKAATRSVWSSVPGRPFLIPGSGELHIRAIDANYDITDKWSGKLLHQSLDSVEDVSDQQIIIHGRFWEDRDDNVTYSLSIQAMTEHTLAFKATWERYRNTWDDPEYTYPQLQRMALHFACGKHEQFMGLGSQFSYFNFKGKRVPVLTSEQGVGRGLRPLTDLLNWFYSGAGREWSATYSAVPYYISSLSRSLYLEGNDYSVFDFRKQDRVTVESLADRQVFRWRVIAGATPAAIIKEYTSHVGRMKPLPDWAHRRGAIVGLQGGTDTVMKHYKALQAAGTPIAALWLQDWSGQRITPFGKRLWWNWELDDQRYPNWGDMLCQLDGEGVRVMTYVNPHVVDVNNKGYFKRNLFREAADLGCLVKNKTGQPFLVQSATPDFQLATVDFTSEFCTDWYVNIIRKNLLQRFPCHEGDGSSREVHVAGWMADFGEHLPWDGQLHSGEPAHQVHSRYPQDWAAVNARAIAEEGLEDDIVFFSRSRSTLSSQYSRLFWNGDQLVTWDAHDGMKTALMATLTAGLSGVALTHSDVGGYTMLKSWYGITYFRSKQLLLRWMELSAFADAVFRSHEGNRPADSVQVYTDEETMSSFALFAQVHLALGDYRAALMAEAFETGMPIARHMWLHYPGDPEILAHNQQFLLGRDLLVAPVMNADKTTVVVYLPAGEAWSDVIAERVYGPLDKGTTITLDAPLGRPGLLLRRGASKLAREAASRVKKLLLGGEARLAQEEGSPHSRSDEEL